MKRAFWKGLPVLLTGHTGFKGSWLTAWLRQLEARVVGYALPPPTTPSLFADAALADGINDVRGDVRDRALLTRALRDAAPEVVFHLAAQPLVRASYREPAETFETNVLGTVNVLEAARATESVRAVVVVTSDKCYENREQLWGYREHDPLGGHDPYSASKACAEIVAASYRRSFFAKGSARVASGRAGNVIGGGDYATDRLVPDLVRAFSAGSSALIRNPASTRPWQHVLDPLLGYLELAERLYEGAADEAWNFGPPAEDVRAVSTFADDFVAAWGGSVRWHHDALEQPHEARLLTLDATKARTLLGWRPRLPYAEAVRWTAEWYRRRAQGEDARTLTSRQISAYQELAS